MNREQRRKAAKQKAKNKKKPVQADAVRINQIQKQTINYTIELLGSIMCLALHDEFGFGKKRLEKLFEKMTYFFNDFEAGIISSDDMKEVIEDELKIKIKMSNILKAGHKEGK